MQGNRLQALWLGLLGEQPHRVALATDNQPVAIVLDLMHPVRTSRRLGGAGWDAGLDEAVGASRNHALPYRLVTPAGNCHSVAELFCSRRRSMVKRKTPSPKAKKVIVKHMVKDAKRLRTAYAKGKKKKFQWLMTTDLR
jgi:hypothetical protein